ncbi:MAG TPA: hypothetical protein VMV44_01610 [Rectinemataceae bacterium]|nr:hypothetical protein [Rectinemataceae bacterium]
MKRFFVLFAVAAVFAMGCTTFTASGLGQAPSGSNYTTVGKFDRVIWVNEFLGTSAGAKIFNISSDATDSAISNVIADEVKKQGGTAAINITIAHRASIIDIIFNSLTFHLWAPAEIDISGTVIK